MNRSKFYVAHLDAEKVLIIDAGSGLDLSITNNAENVVMKLNADLLAGGSGGIQGRKVFIAILMATLTKCLQVMANLLALIFVPLLSKTNSKGLSNKV